MKHNNRKQLCAGLILLTGFVIWTLLISFVDVQAIGPNGSSVGFATINGAFHDLTGVHMTLYYITDWLGLVPLAVAFGFAILGLVQLIKRRSFLKVDFSILILGGYYIIVIAAYLLFEMYAINYRPVLIDGFLEASYPSSTTLLVLSVMPTAILQLRGRIKNERLMIIIKWSAIGFSVFMVLGRTIAGVHWLTDIIGSVILSAGLVLLYDYVSKLRENVPARECSR